VHHFIDDQNNTARYILIQLRWHHRVLARAVEPCGFVAYNDQYEALSVIEDAMEHMAEVAVPWDSNSNFPYRCKNALRFWNYLDRIGWVRVHSPKNDEEAEREKDELAGSFLEPLSLVNAATRHER